MFSVFYVFYVKNVGWVVLVVVVDEVSIFVVLGVVSLIVFLGIIFFYVGNVGSILIGWLFCDGIFYGVNEYLVLFNLINIIYGVELGCFRVFNF